MRSINIGANSMETIFRQIQFDRPIITTEFTEQQTSFTQAGQHPSYTRQCVHKAHPLLRVLLLVMLLIAGSTWGEVWGVDYTYTYIVVNKNSKEAIRYSESQTAGATLALPKYIKSPMLPTSAFHYYADDQFTDNGSGDYTQTGVTELDVLPNNAATIYVTYDDYDGSLFNLNRERVYYLVHNTDFYLYTKNKTNAAYSWDAMSFWQTSNKNVSVAGLTDNYRLWEFYSANNDPYDVRIYNYGYTLANNEHFICMQSNTANMAYWGD